MKNLSFLCHCCVATCFLLHTTTFVIGCVPSLLLRNRIPYNIPIPKIVNGVKLRYDDGHPYLVSIQLLGWRDALNSWYIPVCSGIILNHRTIITTAHCFDYQPPCSFDELPDCYRIVAGEYNLEKKEPEREQSAAFSLQAVVIHEDYDNTSYANDIAIIHLEKSLRYNKYVRNIKLSQPNVQYEETGIIAGWGSPDMNSDQSEILQEAHVSIFGNEHCEQKWGNDFRPEIMFCAGSKNDSLSGTLFVADACIGDSGGPFVVYDFKKPQRKHLMGLISWGGDCGSREYPGVYVRLTSYMTWMQREMVGRTHIKQG